MPIDNSKEELENIAEVVAEELLSCLLQLGLVITVDWGLRN